MLACSGGEKAVDENQQEQPEILVFEDIPKVDTSIVAKDTVRIEQPEPVVEPLITNQKINNQEVKIDTVAIEEKSINYIVQVGAFSTEDRAETFVKENQSKIDLKLSLVFNDQTKLFTIQLPPFITRDSAELVRDSIRQIQVFKDAFIITKEE